MKKIVPVILAALMLCAVCAAEGTDLTGLWYGKLLGFPITMTVNGDGTMISEMDGEEFSSGAWEIEGDRVYINRGTEEEEILIIDGENLHDEIGMISYTREPVADAPEQIAAAQAADFDGTWQLVYVDVYGMTIAAEEMEEVMNIGFNPKDAKIVVNDGMVTVFDSAPAEFAFENGSLIHTETQDGTDYVTVLSLFDDGSLFCDANGLRFCCERK